MGERFSELSMYTEGFMPGGVRLLRSGKIKCVSTGGLSVDSEFANEFLSNIDEYSQKLILRPAEVCNSPEVISRLGVIAMNNILEADIYGNVNSTNVMGTRMVSGIGGSGDFARNALLTAFFTLSTARGGAVSSIVPMCPHVDHTEHDVDVIVTEHGVADLRNKSPPAAGAGDDTHQPSGLQAAAGGLFRARLRAVRGRRGAHAAPPLGGAELARALQAHGDDEAGVSKKNAGWRAAIPHFARNRFT